MYVRVNVYGILRMSIVKTPSTLKIEQSFVAFLHINWCLFSSHCNKTHFSKFQVFR